MVYKIWCQDKYPTSLGKYEYTDKPTAVARAVEMVKDGMKQVHVLKVVATAEQYTPVTVRIYGDE